MFLRLNCLMKTVRVTSAGHDTACEFIDNKNLIILDNIVVIFRHQIVCAKREDNAVLDLKVLRVREVVQMEKSFHLGNALRRQIDNLVFLVDDEIAGLFLLNAHDGINLGKVLHVLAAGHLLGENIAGFIDLCGFIRLAGNNKRRACLINQDRVNLIDNRVMQAPQNQLVLVDGHVVTQIVKAQLVVRHIGDVAGIGSLPLLGGHLVKDNAAGQPHKAIYLPHPLCVALREIIVHRNDHGAFAFKCVQIRRKRRNKRLAFAGLHLRDSTLMKNNAADQLHAERFHSDRALRALPDSRKSLRENIVQRFSFGKPFLKLPRLVRKRLV